MVMLLVTVASCDSCCDGAADGACVYACASRTWTSGVGSWCEKLLKTLNDQLSQLLSRCSYSATKRRSWRRSCDSVYV